MHLRKGTPSDLPFLRQMLYEAVYWRGGDRPEIEEGLATPELSKLLANWGRLGDTAFLAEEASTTVGAGWYRLWDDANHSYGYISSAVPELAVAVPEQCRRKGIGRSLLESLLREASLCGYSQLSLSVERDNPALALYQSLNFKIIKEVGNAYTMIANTDRTVNFRDSRLSPDQD
jgi:ribosomal protein S18 acetylase RimI-like enzyme